MLTSAEKQRKGGRKRKRDRDKDRKKTEFLKYN